MKYRWSFASGSMLPFGSEARAGCAARAGEAPVPGTEESDLLVFCWVPHPPLWGGTEQGWAPAVLGRRNFLV